MTWGLAILLIVIFIALTALVFIQFDTTPFFVETYFIIVIIALFVILLFTIDFDNPISTTVYIRTAKDQSPLIYDVPYNADTGYSNLMSAAFAGNYSGATTPVNTTPASDTVVFNYDTFTTASLLGGKILLTKLPGYQLQVDIKPTEGADHEIDGFLTLNLLCTGSQSINNKFNLV
jgi:hypothetical protein